MTEDGVLPKSDTPQQNESLRLFSVPKNYIIVFDLIINYFVSFPIDRMLTLFQTKKIADVLLFFLNEKAYTLISAFTPNSSLFLSKTGFTTLVRNFST